MINKNYIILAHNNPNQLNRLIKRLDDGFSHFYIHIDKNVDFDLFSYLKNISCVSVIKDRTYCIWGDFSLVQATINSIKQIIYDKREYYTILLSGQCYPIVDNLTINNYLKQNISFNHIDLASVEDSWINYEDKINKYKINFSKKKEDYIIVSSFLDSDFKTNLKNLREVFVLIIKRKNIFLLFLYLKTFKKRKCRIPNHYGGSQWWAFNFNTLNEVFKFIENNDDYIDFHKNTHIPDEIFFQTIIKYLSIENRTIMNKKSLTYVNWEKHQGKIPVLFNQYDFEEIKLQLANNKFFARKFDSNYCEKIFDLLD